MQIALISDIHANLPALTAVLKVIREKKPDMILSLGDQVNLGPCPKETLFLLKEHGVRCLHGNHERYILSAMAGDEAYAGANFESLRFNAALMTAEELTFPKEMQLEGITFCHALPGDDRFPVYDPAAALPRLRAMSFPSGTHIICGHGHNPTHYRMPGFRLDSIGSTGCMDEGPAGAAPFTLLTLEKDAAVFQPFYVSYDTSGMRQLFRQSGMAEFCPIMAHIACLQMERNRDYIVPFVQKASQLAQQKGEQRISMATWQEADRRFAWPGGISTAAYWRSR